MVREMVQDCSLTAFFSLSLFHLSNSECTSKGSGWSFSHTSFFPLFLIPLREESDEGSRKGEKRFVVRREKEGENWRQSLGNEKRRQEEMRKWITQREKRGKREETESVISHLEAFEAWMNESMARMNESSFIITGRKGTKGSLPKSC